jgi:hypothetical protein
LTYATAESSILDNSANGIYNAQMAISGPASIYENTACQNTDEGSSVDDLKPIAGRSSKRDDPLAIDETCHMDLTLTVDSTIDMPFVQSNVGFSCMDYANHLLQLSVSSDDEDPDDAIDILHLPYSRLEDSSFDEFSRLECIDQMSSEDDDILDDVSYIDDASQSSHDDSEVEINDTYLPINLRSSPVPFGKLAGRDKNSSINLDDHLSRPFVDMKRLWKNPGRKGRPSRASSKRHVTFKLRGTPPTSPVRGKGKGTQISKQNSKAVVRRPSKFRMHRGKTVFPKRTHLHSVITAPVSTTGTRVRFKVC